MRKLIAGFFACFLLLFTTPVLAQPNNNAQIPERNGDYADPEHPGVRVRVFVHEPRKPDAVVPATCDDPVSSAVVHAAGWKLPQGRPWTYNFNLSSVPASVGSANLSNISSNGFNQWQNAVENKVTFKEGSNTTQTRSAYDGQNIITWGRTAGNALAVTYVRYYKTTKIVVDVDTIMNVKFPWSWTASGSCGDPNTYDAQAVLTHEEGHWLGLDDEYGSAYVNNTMYGYGYKGDIKADTLTIGDINGAKAIY